MLIKSKQNISSQSFLRNLSHSTSLFEKYEFTGLTHTPNTPEILAMMAENMASAEVEGPSRAGGNCGVVGSSGPFVFRPQAPAAASITSIAADLSRSSDQVLMDIHTRNSRGRKMKNMENLFSAEPSNHQHC